MFLTLADNGIALLNGNRAPLHYNDYCDFVWWVIMSLWTISKNASYMVLIYLHILSPRIMLLPFCSYIAHVSMESMSPVHYQSCCLHYSDVIMSMITSPITGVSIVYSNVCSGADQRKHQSSTSLAFVRGIHWWPVNSRHKRPMMQKMFPFMQD